MCEYACVCAGVMERVGALVPRSGVCPGCHPWFREVPFPLHRQRSHPLRSCLLRSARGAPLLPDRPLFCWFLGRRAGGQVRRRRETPPGSGSPRSGSGRLTPAPLQARVALVEADPCGSDKLLLSWLRCGAVTPSPGWPNLLGVPE